MERKFEIMIIRVVDNENKQEKLNINEIDIDSFVVFLLSLDFGKSYNIILEHDGLINLDIMSGLLTRLSEDGIFEIHDVESSDTCVTIEVEYRNPHYSYEKWDDERYIKVLRIENIENFSLEIRGNYKTITYLTEIMNMLRRNYRENLLTQNLFIALQLIDNIINKDEEIEFIIGDFKIVERSPDGDSDEVTYGLSTKVESQFLALIKDILSVDKEKSSLKYLDNKVYLKLHFNKFVFDTSKEDYLDEE